MAIISFSINTLLQAVIGFCRVGSALMLVSGIGEAMLPLLVRLIIALAISINISSIIELPPLGTSEQLILLVIIEVAIGLTIGMFCKIIMSAFQIFGFIVSLQSGLSAGMLFDPSQNSQTPQFSIMMSMLMVVLLINTGFHLFIIEALVSSYTAMPVGGIVSDTLPSMWKIIFDATSIAFQAGIQLSMPFLIVGTILMLGAGVMSRVMPQLQVFFLLLPAQTLVTLILLLMTIAGISLYGITYVTESFALIFNS
jgi:flagellar biosynthetic protein FliR